MTVIASEAKQSRVLTDYQQGYLDAMEDQALVMDESARSARRFMLLRPRPRDTFEMLAASIRETAAQTRVRFVRLNRRNAPHSAMQGIAPTGSAGHLLAGPRPDSAGEKDAREVTR